MSTISKTSPPCRACGNTGPKTTWQVQERMFGTGDIFRYHECPSCGALSINQVPADLSRHYPSNYYSLQAVDSPDPKSLSFLSSLRESLTGTPATSKRTERVLRHIRLAPTSRILDVGCGSGLWLKQLQAVGFEHLYGVDPYLSIEHEVHGSINLRCGTIHDADGDQDLIAYHHVLEHIADPKAEIAAAAACLKPGGHLLVRVPVADCWARRTFATCWVQWDAPRHLWLPTRAALSHLARENGLNEIACIEDSTAFQVWGSRRYRDNLVGWVGKYSPYGRRRDLLLALPGLIAAKVWTAWLNLRRQGDQVTVLWQRPLK